MTPSPAKIFPNTEALEVPNKMLGNPSYCLFISFFITSPTLSIDTAEVSSDFMTLIISSI